MQEWQERTALILGEDALARLANATVAVIGVGGVGAYAAEMVVRAGVGHVILLDSDTVSLSNKNRQLIALDSTVGLPKTEVLRDRLLEINRDLDVRIVSEYLEADEVASVLDAFKMDFLIDAIDTIAPKMALIKYCYERRIKSVSSMGAGAKSDVTKVRIADISRTFNCSLAFVVRRRLRKMGITKGVKVVFSEEVPDRSAIVPCVGKNKNSLVGSISYLPAVFGCACAQAAIKYLSTER